MAQDCPLMLPPQEGGRQTVEEEAAVIVIGEQVCYSECALDVVLLISYVLSVVFSFVDNAKFLFGAMP